MTLLDNKWSIWNCHVLPTADVIPSEICDKSPVHLMDFIHGLEDYHQNTGEVNDLNLLEFGGR